MLGYGVSAPCACICDIRPSVASCSSAVNTIVLLSVSRISSPEHAIVPHRKRPRCGRYLPRSETEAPVGAIPECVRWAADRG